MVTQVIGNTQSLTTWLQFRPRQMHVPVICSYLNHSVPSVVQSDVASHQVPMRRDRYTYQSESTQLLIVFPRKENMCRQ